MIYYKTLDEYCRNPFSDGLIYSRRTAWPVDGDWVAVTGPLLSHREADLTARGCPLQMNRAAEAGLHVYRRSNLVSWLSDTIWEVDVDGEMIERDDKVVVRRARLARRLTAWNVQATRLLAADCAEHVLPVFENACPGDDRPRQAIAAVRAFVRQEIDLHALDTARDAVTDCLQSDRIRAAESAVGNTGVLAIYRAAGAARNAAGDPQWDAVVYPRTNADIYFQEATGRAAGEAVWDACRAAAWSASGELVRESVFDAELGKSVVQLRWDAAGDAAWRAETAWQTERLFHYLEGGD